MAIVMVVVGVLVATHTPALEEIGRIRVVAPRSLAGARVFVGSTEFGVLTFQQKTGPSRVSLVLDLAPDTEFDIKIEKVGFVPILKGVRSPRPYRLTRLTISANEVKRVPAA